MRWLMLATAALCGAAACSSDAGAILVLDNPGGMPVAKVEVVLASASGDNGEDTIITVKQRVAVMAKVMEDVRYYKQESTSKVVELGGKDAENFSVILTQPAGAPSGKKYIPFVFAYDDQGALVGVGRVTMGDDQDTPAAIAIPTGSLEQFPIVLEPMTPPDLVETGVARDTGTVVTCETDGVVRGAAWKFSKGIQMRIVFAKPGETNGVANPYDLDCDAHVVDATAAAMDCNDLRDVTYPGAPEVCGDDDRNCDAMPPDDQMACVLKNPDPTRAVRWGDCAGLTGCPNQPGGATTCAPDPSDAADNACFCLDAAACITQLDCRMEVGVNTESGAVTRTACTPEVSNASLENPCEATPATAAGSPCLVTILSAPANLTVELGVPTALDGSVTFDTAPIMLNGMPQSPQDRYFMRITDLSSTPPAMPPQEVGDVVLLAQPPSPAPAIRYFVHLATKSVSDPTPGCSIATLPGINGGNHVNTMQCVRSSN